MEDLKVGDNEVDILKKELDGLDPLMENMRMTKVKKELLKKIKKSKKYTKDDLTKNINGNLLGGEIPSCKPLIKEYLKQFIHLFSDEHFRMQIEIIISNTNNFTPHDIWKWEHKLGNSHIKFEYNKGTPFLEIWDGALPKLI